MALTGMVVVGAPGGVRDEVGPQSEISAAALAVRPDTAADKSDGIDGDRAGGLPCDVLALGTAAVAQARTPFLAGVAMGHVLRSDIPEASGVAVSRQNPGVVWTHDDSGGANVVFALSTCGTVLGIYQLGSGVLRDAEDIALGPGPLPGIDYLYVGDIGDNASVRSTICVKRVPEPQVAVTPGQDFTVLPDVDILTLAFPSGADAPDHKDCETLFVDTNGDIYLVTKRLAANRVYRAPFPQSTSQVNVLEYVTTLPQEPALRWITGGDCSRDGAWIIVKNDGATDYASIWYRPPGTDLWDAFGTTPYTLRLDPEPQGEAIGWDPLSGGFFTLSEAHHESEPLWFYGRG